LNCNVLGLITSPPSRTANSPWTWTLLLVALIATWLDLSRLHAFQGSDSLVPVLMSLQRWTPFFWGQDRFGMLVPLITMPVRSPLANMLAQSWLMLVAALLAPFMVARWLAGRESGWLLAGTLTNALLLTLVKPLERFDWLVVQPYALSLTLGTAGLLAAERLSIASTAAALVLMLLAHWVNVGIAAVLVPLVLLRGRVVIRSMLVAVVGAAGGIAVTSLAVPVTRTDFIPLSRWPAAWLQLLAQTISPILYPAAGLGIAVGAAAGAAFLCTRAGRRDSVRPASIALFTAAAYWLFVGTSRWVQMNQYFPRYVYPSILLCTVAAGLIAADLLQNRAKPVTALIAAVLAIATGVRYGSPSPRTVRSTLDQRFGRMTPDIIMSGASAIGGNYWAVWPAVFHANLTRYEEAGGRRPVYGLTLRSSETNAYWTADPGVVLAAARGDIEVERFADRAGLSIDFVGRRGTIDIFKVRLKADATGAKPDATGAGSNRTREPAGLHRDSAAGTKDQELTRLVLKNSCISIRHSCSRTPATTSNR
jgi:hypothetical protein